MKIIVIPSGGDYSKKSVAAVIHTTEIVKHLSKSNKITIFLNTSDRDAVLPIRSSSVAIKYIPYSKNPLFRFIIRYAFLPFYFGFLFRKIESKVMYARFGALTFSSLIAAKLTNKKYVVELNGLKIDELELLEDRSILRYFKIFVIKILEKFTYVLSDKIIAVTEGIKEGIHRQYNISLSKIDVVPNGANIDLFRPIDNAKEKLNLEKDIKIVGFTGTLYAWQGVDFLIQAAPEIIKKIPDVKFIIVGDGEERGNLEKRIQQLNLKDNFLFTGAIEYAKVPVYINAFDICVSLKKPLKSGYSTLKLYEYLACGKPVITTETPGLSDLIEKNNIGISVDQGAIPELSNAIVSLLNNTTLIKEMGRRARAVVEEKYSWRASAGKIEDILKDL